MKQLIIENRVWSSRIVHFADGTRFCRYMTTIELDVSLNIEEFLRNTSSAKTLDDVKLQDANAVFAAIESALALYHLSFDNLVYLMTDNCTTMTGKHAGVKAKVRDVSPRMIDFPGCSVVLIKPTYC